MNQKTPEGVRLLIGSTDDEYEYMTKLPMIPFGYVSQSWPDFLKRITNESKQQQPPNVLNFTGVTKIYGVPIALVYDIQKKHIHVQSKRRVQLPLWHDPFQFYAWLNKDANRLTTLESMVRLLVQYLEMDHPEIFQHHKTHLVLYGELTGTELDYHPSVGTSNLPMAWTLITAKTVNNNNNNNPNDTHWIPELIFKSCTRGLFLSGFSHGLHTIYESGYARFTVDFSSSHNNNRDLLPDQVRTRIDECTDECPVFARRAPPSPNDDEDKSKSKSNKSKNSKSNSDSNNESKKTTHGSDSEKEEEEKDSDDEKEVVPMGQKTERVKAGAGMLFYCVINPTTTVWWRAYGESFVDQVFFHNQGLPKRVNDERSDALMYVDALCQSSVPSYFFSRAYMYVLDLDTLLDQKFCEGVADAVLGHLRTAYPDQAKTVFVRYGADMHELAMQRAGRRWTNYYMSSVPVRFTSAYLNHCFSALLPKTGLSFPEWTCDDETQFLTLTQLVHVLDTKKIRTETETRYWTLFQHMHRTWNERRERTMYYHDTMDKKDAKETTTTTTTTTKKELMIPDLSLVQDFWRKWIREQRCTFEAWVDVSPETLASSSSSNNNSTPLPKYDAIVHVSWFEIETAKTSGVATVKLCLMQLTDELKTYLPTMLNHPRVSFCVSNKRLDQANETKKVPDYDPRQVALFYNSANDGMHVMSAPKLGAAVDRHRPSFVLFKTQKPFRFDAVNEKSFFTSSWIKRKQQTQKENADKNCLVLSFPLC